jgi:hypothetical protein
VLHETTSSRKPVGLLSFNVELEESSNRRLKFFGAKGPILEEITERVVWLAV